MLSSMPRGEEEHEREQRERLVGAGEPEQVAEHPPAHPEGRGEGEHHGDDQQQRGEQGAEQQGQHEED